MLIGETGAGKTLALKLAAGLQIVDLPFQARSLQRPFGNQDQTIGLERLLDEVVSAEFDRRHRRLDVAVTRNHHHRHGGMLAFDRLEQLQPIQLRSLQPDVEEDQLRAARFDRCDGLVRVARQARTVSLILQDAGDEFADVLFVVDDENVSNHQDDPILSFSGCAPSCSWRCKGSLIKTFAPRPPSLRASPSSNSTPPPWSSNILTTIGKPRPVPSARVVT